MARDTTQLFRRHFNDTKLCSTMVSEKESWFGTILLKGPIAKSFVKRFVVGVLVVLPVHQQQKYSR